MLDCQGLRADESPNRAKLTPFRMLTGDSTSIKGREWYEWLPIFDWTTEEVFEKIENSGQKPHWAYEEGMSRLSCSFCIMSSKNDLCTAAKLRPKLLKKIVDLETRTGHTFVHDKRNPGRILDQVIADHEAKSKNYLNSIAQKTEALRQKIVPTETPNP